MTIPQKHPILTLFLIASNLLFLAGISGAIFSEGSPASAVPLLGGLLGSVVFSLALGMKAIGNEKEAPPRPEELRREADHLVRFHQNLREEMAREMEANAQELRREGERIEQGEFAI